MKRTAFLAFLFLASGLFAQNITINGTGKNINGQHIRLFVSEDNFSGLEVQKGDVRLSDNENEFQFAFTADGANIVTLKINAFEYSFIARPGNIYNLGIDSINYAIADSVNVLLHKYIMPIRITNLAENDINVKMSEFDGKMEDFIALHGRELLVNKDSLAVKGLYDLVNGFLKNEDSTSYFAIYVKYELGKLEYVLRLKGRKKQRLELFGDKPIQYYNLGYTDCFNHIFGHYFSHGNKYISQDELEFWLSNNNYDDLTDALGKDEVLKNEVFRELVLIKGMKDAFSDGLYDGQDIIKMLEKVASRTKFEEHRKIALNTVEYLVRTSRKGLQSKDFALTNLNGEKQSLQQYLGKPLVLNFVKLDDVTSKRELEVVNFMYDGIKDECEILTICCDKNLDAMYNFLQNNKTGNKYKWKFAYFDANYDLLEYYQVKAFPIFILISPDGKVEENPMKEPSEGSLMRFMPKEKQK